MTMEGNNRLSASQHGSLVVYLSTHVKGRIHPPRLFNCCLSTICGAQCIYGGILHNGHFFTHCLYSRTSKQPFYLKSNNPGWCVSLFSIPLPLSELEWKDVTCCVFGKWKDLWNVCLFSCDCRSASHGAFTEWFIQLAAFRGWCFLRIESNPDWLFSFHITSKGVWTPTRSSTSPAHTSVVNSEYFYSQLIAQSPWFVNMCGILIFPL